MSTYLGGSRKLSPSNLDEVTFVPTEAHVNPLPFGENKFLQPEILLDYTGISDDHRYFETLQ